MVSKLRFRTTACLLAVFPFFAQSVVLAGKVGIAPIRVFLDAETRTAVVEVSNPGDSPIGMQADVMSWHQDDDGTDRYEPTTELLAFPPIFTIQPGKSQLVRIGLMTAHPAEKEQAYRLYLTELPPPVTDAQGTSLQMRLRIGLPVFSAPLSPPRLGLLLVDSQVEGDQLRVRLHNPGNTHIRVADLYVDELADKPRSNAARYILPSASQEFLVDLPAGTTVSTIQAVTDQLGIQTYEIDLSAPVVPTDVGLASR